MNRIKKHLAHEREVLFGYMRCIRFIPSQLLLLFSLAYAAFP